MKKAIENMTTLLVLVTMCVAFFTLGYTYANTKMGKAHNEPKIIVTTEETTEAELTADEIVTNYFGESGYKAITERFNQRYLAWFTIYNADGTREESVGVANMNGVVGILGGLEDGQHVVINGKEVN